MTTTVARRQGQPVLFLGLLFGGWCLLRVLTWQNPWPDELVLPEALRFAEIDLPTQGVPRAQAGAFLAAEPSEARAGRAAGFALLLPRRASETSAVPVPQPDYAAHFDTHRRALGHNLLFAAGMAYLPMPRSVAAALDRPQVAHSARLAAPEQRPGSAWRVDAWVLLREGGTSLIGGGERPASYGADQIGAVLAYRLAPGSAHAPAAYARVTHALAEGGEADVALGLRAQPLPGVPLAVHAEGRLTYRPGHAAEIRPAAFVAGGFDSLTLPAGISARGYGQAGYVGGEFATAFVDGALVAERPIARFDLGTVSLGAGAWGGAQRGAARLDLGPSVSVALELGGAPARIEADYRWRVAGRAEPGNGGALTVSTGF